MKYIILALKGIAIGIANAIPGVSGGTIAVVTKLYDSLIEAITPNIKKLIKNIPLLLPVGLGMLAGIFLAAKVLGYLFETHNVPTQLFFIGLIVGSLPMIFKECIKEHKLKIIDIIPFLAGVGVMVMMALFDEKSVSGGAIELNLVNGLLMFAAAFLAALAMIIPGVSGSMLMKVIGVYDTIIMAVNNLDFPVLIVFALGAIVGIFATAKIISLLLKKCRKATYCVIIGLIIGSIPEIFPAGFEFNSEGFIGIALLAVGLIIPTLTELPSAKKKKQEKI